MKKRLIRMIIIVLIAIVMLLGIVFLSKSFKQKEPSKIPLNRVQEDMINTQQEAIDYAKQNGNIISFVEHIKDLGNFDAGYDAYYNENLGVWKVLAYAKNADDLDYQISFYPNGTITFLGTIPM
jgi:hypothetical protein